MKITLKKNIKVNKVTIFKDTVGHLIGVSNSSTIKKEFNDIKDDGYFYIVNFPTIGEVVVAQKDIQF